MKILVVILISALSCLARFNQFNGKSIHLCSFVVVDSSVQRSLKTVELFESKFKDDLNIVSNNLSDDSLIVIVHRQNKGQEMRAINASKCKADLIFILALRNRIRCYQPENNVIDIPIPLIGGSSFGAINLHFVVPDSTKSVGYFSMMTCYVYEAKSMKRIYVFNTCIEKKVKEHNAESAYYFEENLKKIMSDIPKQCFNKKNWQQYQPEQR